MNCSQACPITPFARVFSTRHLPPIYGRISRPYLSTPVMRRLRNRPLMMISRVIVKCLSGPQSENQTKHQPVRSQSPKIMIEEADDADSRYRCAHKNNVLVLSFEEVISK